MGSHLFRLARRLLGAGVCIVVVLAASACGGTGNAGSGGTVVQVRERDFAISAPTRVAAGLIDLRAANRGPDAHELIVVRAGESGLPLRTDGLTVNEEGLARETVGALEPGQPGAVRDLRLRLRPGRYVLFCNMAGHYLGGMHRVLVVS